jgi:Tol biopolymer transport system component
MIAKFKKTSLKRSVAAVLVMMVLACITLTDAYPADLPFIFGTPTNLGPTVNSLYGDSGPSISADGLSLFFHSNRPGGSGDWDLWVATRKTPDDEWSEPVNLGPKMNSRAFDACPCISADGLSLFFTSRRLDGQGGEDLWEARRKTPDDPWGAPVNIGPVVNSPYDERGPSISSDGLSLYFGSNRPDSLGVIDLWVSTRKSVSDPWSAPVNLGPKVNGPDSSEFHPSISSDGLMLFFSSSRGGVASGRMEGFGGAGDLCVAMRPSTSASWSEVENLGPPVNSVFRELGPSISADGRTLYFVSSLRPDGDGSYDLWQVPILSFRAQSESDGDGKPTDKSMGNGG